MSAGTPFYQAAAMLDRLAATTDIFHSEAYLAMRGRVAEEAVVIVRSVTPHNQTPKPTDEDPTLEMSTHSDIVGNVIAIRASKTVGGHAVADWVINGRDWVIPALGGVLSGGIGVWGPFAYARPSKPNAYPQRAANRIQPMLQAEGQLFLDAVKEQIRREFHV